MIARSRLIVMRIGPPRQRRVEDGFQLSAIREVYFITHPSVRSDFAPWSLREHYRRYFPRVIARRASARPISTKAEVTSGPPTKIRVGVFILFHS